MYCSSWKKIMFNESSQENFLVSYARIVEKLKKRYTNICALTNAKTFPQKAKLQWSSHRVHDFDITLEKGWWSPIRCFLLPCLCQVCLARLPFWLPGATKHNTHFLNRLLICTMQVTQFTYKHSSIRHNFLEHSCGRILHWHNRLWRKCGAGYSLLYVGN